MKLSEKFLNLYDKTKEQCVVANGLFRVFENSPTAELKTLDIEASGDFVCFNDSLLKGRGGFSKLTSKIQDKDCDGIAFYVDENGSESLVLVDLKSTLGTASFAGVMPQIAMSFLKLYSWLSLCDEYRVNEIPICFIVACSSLKYNSGWEKSQFKELEVNSIENEDDLFYKLVKSKSADVKLGLLSCIKDKGFSKDLCERTIRVRLVDSNNRPTASLSI